MTAEHAPLQPPSERPFGNMLVHFQGETHLRELNQEPHPGLVRAGHIVGNTAILLAAGATVASGVGWAVQSGKGDRQMSIPWTDVVVPISSEDLPVSIPWTEVIVTVPSETWTYAPAVAVGATAVATIGIFAFSGGAHVRRTWRQWHAKRNMRLARKYAARSRQPTHRR
jgi:hypothetical protein